MNVPHPLPALYWMWRQRSLDIHPWEEINRTLPLDGARVAVVGNAGYLADLEQGSTIDACDLVLRMNNFRLGSFERQVGRRIDIYMSNFYVPDIDFTNPDIGKAQWIFSSRPNTFRKPKRDNLDLRYGEHLTNGLLQIGASHAYAPSLSYIQTIAARLGECPTTGLMAILLATEFLMQRCSSVYLTGFSFFEGKSHYFHSGETKAFSHHNVTTEKALLAEHLTPLWREGRVTCDATVASHLGFTS